MKIEIWSDFGCPFCYIGKKRFEEVLATFGHPDEVKTHYRSYELYPNATVEGDISNLENMVRTGTKTAEEAQHFWEKVKRLAKTAGLTFVENGIPFTNTHNAHRLAMLAEKHGKRKEMAARLFEAYMTEGMNIGRHDVLQSLAHEIGLPNAEVVSLLESALYSNEVRAEEKRADEMGLDLIPAFYINGKPSISGIVRPEQILDALNEHLNEQ
ncbi:MAG: DsbA family oxidoreductase [Bacteroidales bacterium]|nr:DsbA family oxidoreductase [Bacteroidales bacterium]